MRLGKRNADTEFVGAEARSCRKAGNEVARESRHIGSCFIVVAHADVETVGRSVFHCKDKMPEQISHKIVLQNERRIGVVCILTGIIGQFPAVKVDCRNRQAERSAVERLCIA